MQKRIIAASSAAMLAMLSEPAAASNILHMAAADIIVAAHAEDRQLHDLSTPSFGTALTPAQLQAVNALNAEDLLRQAPSTIVRKRYAGDPNATLSFRNMHSQQTPRALVLVDGFPISNFLGADWDTAPRWGVLGPNDIERIEIIYGPTSARHSGHSMGGTMLIRTNPIGDTALHAQMQAFSQDYRYYATDEQLFGWSVDAGADLALGEHGGIAFSYRHFRNRGQPQEWRMVAAGSPYGDQAIIDPELPFLRIGAQDSTVDTRQDQLRLRGETALGTGWTLRGLLALLLVADDALHPKSFLQDADGRPSFIGINGINRNLSRRSELLSGVAAEGEIAGWTTSLRYSRFDTLRHQTRTSDNIDPATGLQPATGRLADVDAGWQNLALEGSRRIGAHTLALGTSLDHYAHHSQTYLRADWRAGHNGLLRDAARGHSRLIGAYAEDAIRMGDITTTLGLRIEHWRASNGLLQSDSETVRYPARQKLALSPKLAISIRPDAASRITASLALATRFPTVRELYQPGLVQYGAGAGGLDLNGFDPSLRPERGFDLQLTAMRQFGPVHVTLNGWRQDLRDMIFSQSIAIPDPLSGDLMQSTLMTNIGRLRSHGMDLLVSAEELFLPGLSLDANLSWTDAGIRKNQLNPALEHKRFPRIPRWRLNAGLRYAPAGNWDLAASIRHQSTPDRNLENDATSKCGTFFCVTGFSFVDLKARYRVAGLEISAGIDNLLNEKAFVYHPYPGRSFLIGVAWTGARQP